MSTLRVGDDRYTVERARADDVPALVALLADDVIGATRETADLDAYRAAFAAIDADPANLLVAVRDAAGGLVGTCQLTVIPGLSRGGATRLLVEAVRLAPSARGGGLGTALFGWIDDYARSRGATLVQLTSDRTRTDALRFYERLGYTGSHVGFKKPLGD